MPKREMPPKGYYQYKGYGIDRVIFVSGETKGNMWWDSKHTKGKWNKLLWTCVPGTSELQSNYSFTEYDPIKENNDNNFK